MKDSFRYIPQGYDLLAKDDRFGFEAHGKEMAGKFYAICFRGKAMKPVWHYSFNTFERMKAKIDETLKQEMDAAEYKAKRKDEKKAACASHDVKPGDIFRASWGYDQTNIDYFQIIAISGQMATIRAIGCMSEETGFMSGESVPALNCFIGEPFRARIQKYNQESEPYFRLYSFANAYRMKPLAMIGNNPVFSSSHWTAYA